MKVDLTGLEIKIIIASIDDFRNSLDGAIALIQRPEAIKVIQDLLTKLKKKVEVINETT